MITNKTDLIIPYPELRGSLASMRYPAFIEVKKDGEFAYVHVEKRRTFTVNKEGKIRQSFNYLDSIELAVYKAGYKSATFLAELTMLDGKSGSFYDLLKNKENNELKLWVFDILQANYQDLRSYSLIDRREKLAEILKGIENPVRLVHDREGVESAFQSIVSMGYEGIVVKSLTGKLVLDSCDWVKVKYKDRTDYKVNLVDNTQERIEILAPLPGQKTIHLNGFVKVGVKASNKYKKHIKVGDMVTIEHQGVLASGSLRHPVLIPKPEWK